MPRSVCVHPDRLSSLDAALQRKRFLTKGALAGHLEMARSTVSNFCTGKNVSLAKFEEICDALGLDASEMVQPLQASASPEPTATPPKPSVFDSGNWVERREITETLLGVLRGSCRVLVLNGITGIGKTALVERLIDELEDERQWVRLNLDDGSLSPDFLSSGAALLRTLGQEPSLDDQKDPESLLAHLVSALSERSWRVQIDSLERLLQGNETDGWSEFEDERWADFFARVLAGNGSSQLVVTTQDVPAQLETVGSRYRNDWYNTELGGLDPEEQVELFAKAGVRESEERHVQRLGKLYEGHPLVLRVIAEDVNACGGDVARYWQQCGFERLEQQHPQSFSRRKLKLEVRERVRQSLERLPEGARQLLCRAAVFRRPVPPSFWRALVPELTEEVAEGALDLLLSRTLATEDWKPQAWLGADGAVPLRQHNLIRGVAYELLKAEPTGWQQAERQAARLWLEQYEPQAGVENLETVRGYLEAFEHYCAIEDWQTAGEFFRQEREELPARSRLNVQLDIWGYYREEIGLCERLLGKVNRQLDILCWNGIGNAYLLLSDYSKAIEAHTNSLDAAREIGDRRGEGKALGNLGNAYYSLGEYRRAIAYHEQHLEIAREIGDRQGEGNALGNLGNAYDGLGETRRAIAYYEQYLEIAREIGDRRGEGNALGNLGIAYNNLEEYRRAIAYHEQYLEITREIGDRLGEGIALGNLGSTYFDLKVYQQAIAYHEQALEIAQEIGDRRGEGNALGNLGDTQVKLQEYKPALENLNASLAIFREIQSPASEAEVLKMLAELHYATQNFPQALDDCNAALHLATKLGIPLVQECEELKAKIEAAMANSS